MRALLVLSIVALGLIAGPAQGKAQDAFRPRDTTRAGSLRDTTRDTLPNAPGDTLGGVLPDTASIAVYDRRSDAIWEVRFPPASDWMTDTLYPPVLITPLVYLRQSKNGDVNGDGEIRLSDVILIINYVLKAGEPLRELPPFFEQAFILMQRGDDSLDYYKADVGLIKRR